MYSDKNIRERIWLLPDGIPLKLDSMTVEISGADKLLVTGWTNTINFNNISKENIVQELADLRYSFSDLSKSFAEIIAIVKDNNLTIEYCIAYDDGGKTRITLCSEIEGKFSWYI